MTLSEGEGRIGRPHSFRHHLHAGEYFVDRTPSRELDPDVAISTQGPGARQNEVTQAAQSRECFSLRAGGACKARDLRQASRDQPACALCPSARPSATPAAMAMMFFSAPPISTPTTSLVPYNRK